MIIISAIGGCGSTFIIKTLKKKNYNLSLKVLDLNKLNDKISNHISIMHKPFRFLMNSLEKIFPRPKILRRPDAFWTEWEVFKKEYNPDNPEFHQDIQDQKEFILNNINKRSAGIKIHKSDLKEDSLLSLVKSYVKSMERIEKNRRYKIVLLSGHWGEYGIFKELRLKTIYIIRDPYNALISHSKSNRHEKDYLRRGLKHINNKEWIHCYLKGPHHYWINHAESALNHKNAIIVRYNKFKRDWQKVNDLPDISKEFRYVENNISEILTKESIKYIYEQTHEICEKLGFDEPEIYL